MEELERQMREEEEKKRRPSRFEVTPAPDILKLKTQSTNELMPSMDGVISFSSTNKC
jgi:chloride channel 2